MKRRSFGALIITFSVWVACTGPEKSREELTSQDTVVIAGIDSLSERTEDFKKDSTIQSFPINYDSPEYDLIVGDTMIMHQVYENNPTQPQLDLTVAYVYNKSGIDVYGVNKDRSIDTSKPIGHLNYKSKVKLYSALRSETPVTIEGMRGYYALVQFENASAYVFSGYLLNLPVPETNVSIVNYFLQTLSLHEPADLKQVGIEKEAHWIQNFHFEGGVVIEKLSALEDGDVKLSLPGYNMQQAYLFSTYFFRSFEEYFPVMPADSATVKRSDTMLTKVGSTYNEVDHIETHDSGGCGDHFEVLHYDRRKKTATIRAYGGC